MSRYPMLSKKFRLCGVVYPHYNRKWKEFMGVDGYILAKTPNWHTATLGEHDKATDACTFIFGAFSDTAEHAEYQSVVEGILDITSKRANADFIFEIEQLATFTPSYAETILRLSKQYFLLCESASEARKLSNQLKNVDAIPEVVRIVSKFVKIKKD